ncbi:hypothetical protein D3C72_1548080 [compost metagenome]
MKSLLSALVLMFSAQAFAAADSVAVFHSARKVVVLINEQGSNSRLQNFMNSFNAESNLRVESTESGIRIQCARTTDETSCTFAFFPSENVRVEKKSLNASTTLVDLSLKSSQNFTASFESSRQDQFSIHSDENFIIFQANKR